MNLLDKSNPADQGWSHTGPSQLDAHQREVGRRLGRAGQQRQPTSSRRARVVEESRTLTAEERSRADNGRLRAEEGRSRTVESRSRADDGRSRAEEGRCRADGVRVRLRGRGLWLTRDRLGLPWGGL